MALAHQLRRRFIAAATTPAAATTRSCLLFSRSSLISPPPLQPATLQNAVFRSYNSSKLRNSSLFLGDETEKCFHIAYRKVRFSHGLEANQSKALRFSCVRPEIFISGSSWALTKQSLHKVQFPRSLMPVNVFGSGLRAHCPDISARRTFCHVPRARRKKGEDGFRDKRTSMKISPSGVNSKSKQTKALAGQNRNAEGVTQVGDSVKALEMGGSVVPKLPRQDSGIVNPVRQLVEDGTSDVRIGRSSSSSPVCTSDKVPNKGKHKQHSRSNRKNIQTSDPCAVSKTAAAQPRSSDKVAAKKGNSTKKTQKSHPLPAPENSSGTMPFEVLNVSASKGQQSKNTASRSSKGVKSTKEDDHLVKGQDGAQLSSNNARKQKRRPHGKGKPKGQRTMPSLYPPTGKSVLVVESVTKAKLIQGYLGNMFEVLPSYGHVRDLAARSGSVRPDDDFSMVWEVPSAAWSHLKSITVALSGANNLILASDPDREGEAIAWHILEMLRQQDALREDVAVARVVFNEVTESSIKNALKAPRDIDENLVHAYLARRALDYLIGFNIAPLLWKKLPGCQSAGRVQSAAMSLICDREIEIDKFKPQEYWTVDVKFRNSELDSKSDTSSLSSYLIQLDSKKLNQLSVSSETNARSIEQRINFSKFKVVGYKRNKARKNPPKPYVTSTLQQDAANKLNFSATYTMKLAQKLYEGVQMLDGNAAGLITYMRTDGLHISDEAMKDIRVFVIERYGENFASDSSRKYFRKVKNAKEAHEAIRPTDIRRLPSELVGSLDEDSLRLYALIWGRTMACQMEPAVIDHIQVDIGNHDRSIALRSTSSSVQFPGYQVVYRDSESNAINSDEIEGNNCSEAFRVLSDLKTGDSLFLGEVELKQHHTQPPPRYSEAALVKKLEELGIGRPSTYASIMKVLLDRKYVTIKSRVLYPEFRGRMVSAFLSHHFSEVTDYSFTADMETELDNVSAGLTEWKGLLGDYWTRFSKYCEHAATIDIHHVEKMMEKIFSEFLYASLPDRTCPSCSEGELTFKVSRFGVGYFIGCDQHPACKYIAKTLYSNEEEELGSRDSGPLEEPKFLGHHPQSNEKIFLKKGPYSHYVQVGEDRKGFLPKRANLTQVKDVSTVTVEDALEFLRYPVTLGIHPKDGRPVILIIATGVFKVKHGKSSAVVPKKLKPSEITLEKALRLLTGPGVTTVGRPTKEAKAKIFEDIY